MEKTPSYRKVYISLKKKIKEGEYTPGMLIPTEPELEKQYNVSRTTIRRAMEMLVSEGYVRTKQGRGTEVLDTSTTQKLNFITSISETLAAKGFTVTSKGLCIDLHPVSGRIAEGLEVPDDTLVYRIQRIQCVDDMPINIMVNYIKTSMVPNLERFSSGFTSLYKLLELEYGIVLESATETISATVSDFTESQILQVELGTPLLYSRRITYTKQGPLEYAVNKLLGDKYEYSIYMEGRK